MYATTLNWLLRRLIDYRGTLHIHALRVPQSSLPTVKRRSWALKEMSNFSCDIVSGWFFSVIYTQEKRNLAIIYNTFKKTLYMLQIWTLGKIMSGLLRYWNFFSFFWLQWNLRKTIIPYQGEAVFDYAL